MATRICVGCYHFRLLRFPTTFTEEHGIQYHASFVYKSLLGTERAKKLCPTRNQGIVMKLKQLLMLLFIVSLTSCARTYYDVVMTSVEVPEDYKQQYGESKILSLSNNEITQYKYEDDLVAFTWYVSKTQLNFSLKNKTNHSIRIPWDDIVFINPAGRSMRVIHNGIRLVDRNSEQAPSVVAKNSTLDDILVPSDHIYYIEGQYGGWRTHDVFHNYEYVGAKISVVFPIIIENVTNEYIFRFQATNVYKQ